MFTKYCGGNFSSKSMQFRFKFYFYRKLKNFIILVILNERDAAFGTPE